MIILGVMMVGILILYGVCLWGAIGDIRYLEKNGWKPTPMDVLIEDINNHRIGK